ncbi:hypothetical protein GCM10009795_039920 [Nocardioides hankookensis]|uniref:Uncharacterized protein n=1 Tax=Nocardioides hankookensis TaxID=443157 RepID=A0ABW1LR47_9ACTN
MDGLPWQAITVSGGGWALFGMAMIGLMSGRWFVSRRELDSMEKRALAAEANVAQLLPAVAEHNAMGRLSQATIEAAARKAAERVGGDPT